MIEYLWPAETTTESFHSKFDIQRFRRIKSFVGKVLSDGIPLQRELSANLPKEFILRLRETVRDTNQVFKSFLRLTEARMIHFFRVHDSVRLARVERIYISHFFLPCNDTLRNFRLIQKTLSALGKCVLTNNCSSLANSMRSAGLAFSLSLSLFLRLLLLRLFSPRIARLPS